MLVAIKHRCKDYIALMLMDATVAVVTLLLSKHGQEKMSVQYIIHPLYSGGHVS